MFQMSMSDVPVLGFLRAAASHVFFNHSLSLGQYIVQHGVARKKWEEPNSRPSASLIYCFRILVYSVGGVVQL